ncbi:MAG: hypothetical protein ACTHKS_18115, partial [Gaiellaceae bacterium]
RRVLRAATLLILIGSAAAGAGIAADRTRPTDGARTAMGSELEKPRQTQRPVSFLGHVVRLLAANDYQAAYPFLHPGQRRLFSAAEYVACEQASPVPGTLTSLRVLERRQERIHVAGTRHGRVPSTAVRFELRLIGTIPGEAVTVDLTAHAVSVAGRLTWILPARRLAVHRSGTCGVIAN